MGRIYEAIRKDIEKLRRIDQKIQNREPLTMDEVFDADIALQKLRYVCVYAQEEVPEAFGNMVGHDNENLQNFFVPQNLEQLSQEWEDAMGQEQLDHALNHLSLQTKAEAYVPEITPHNPGEYYEYVNHTLNDIADISWTENYGITANGFGFMVASAHQDLVKNIYKNDFAFDPKDPRNEGLYQFLQKPIREMMKAHGENLQVRDQHDYIEEMEDIVNEFNQNSGHEFPADEVMAHYPFAKALEPIHKAAWNPKGLSSAIKESIGQYAKVKKKKDDPTLGEFVSAVKDRIDDSYFDHAIVLGDDADSKFLKDFMKDPIGAMENHYNEGAQINRNGNRLARDNAQQIAAQRDNYNNARQGKVDRYAQMEANRKQRFESIFRENNPNFDPNRFKYNYSGNAFERFLGRTSKEWTELSNYIDNWKNIGQEKDFDKAADLADKYLRHKFPNVDPKDVTPEMVNGLRGAGRHRGLFCVDLVQAKLAAEQEESQAIYEQANRRFDQLETRLHRGESFQDQLGNDIANDENLIQQPSHHRDEPVNENVIENDNNIEI